MPGACARTAAQALYNMKRPWTAMIGDQGLSGACKTCPALLGGINTISGKLMCEPMGLAHDITHHDPADLLR